MRGAANTILMFGCLSGSVTCSPEVCSLAACHDGFAIGFAPDASWPHGDYHFTIEADGATTTCTGALPLPGCEERELACDREEPVIGESGCALPEDEHAFSSIVFNSHPTRVTVTIEHEGQLIASQTFMPTYQTEQPNGPDCPPTCRNGGDRLDLEFR